MTLLAVDHLSIRASQNLLVADLSFAIAPGERLGLVGESGSGKSLTAMAAIGLLAGELDASGSVILGDTQVVGAPSHSLDRLRGTVAATIFQEPLTALDPLMRIGHQVAEPLHRRARRDQRREAVPDPFLSGFVKVDHDIPAEDGVERSLHWP